MAPATGKTGSVNPPSPAANLLYLRDQKQKQPILQIGTTKNRRRPSTAHRPLLNIKQHFEIAIASPRQLKKLGPPPESFTNQNPRVGATLCGRPPNDRPFASNSNGTRKFISGNPGCNPGRAPRAGGHSSLKQSRTGFIHLLSITTERAFRVFRAFPGSKPFAPFVVVKPQKLNLL